MTYQTVLSEEIEDHSFYADCPLRLQIRITNDPENDVALHGFLGQEIPCDSYIVIYPDKAQGHNYQFPLGMEQSDVTFRSGEFCRACLKHNATKTTNVQTWFRGPSRNENISVCENCVEEFLSLRDEYVKQIGTEKMLAYHI